MAGRLGAQGAGRRHPRRQMQQGMHRAAAGSPNHAANPPPGPTCWPRSPLLLGRDSFCFCSTVSTAKNTPATGALNPAATPAPAPAAIRLVRWRCFERSMEPKPVAVDLPMSTEGPSGPSDAPAQAVKKRGCLYVNEQHGSSVAAARAVTPGSAPAAARGSSSGSAARQRQRSGGSAAGPAHSASTAGRRTCAERHDGGQSARHRPHHRPRLQLKLLDRQR